jgi:hypothetical protein
MSRFFTNRLANCFLNHFSDLAREDINPDSLEFAKRVSGMSKAELMRVTNLGKVCAFEVQQWLSTFGLKLSTQAEEARAAIQETRERAQLIRLKAKYELAQVKEIMK